ncbi:MAG: nucleotidyltransferase domain-containing protein [Lachnospiraceae bacterium]|nr:nucleotidyltransferase domain-containing protein [Lachnospiraceae bacterium]
MMTKEMIDNAMKDCAKEVREIYGDKLKEIILFGSCARGDFDSESDMDEMILLDVSRDNIPTERRKIRTVIEKLDEKYDYEILFSTVMRSYDEFNKYLKASPFYGSVNREGIKYA